MTGKTAGQFPLLQGRKLLLKLAQSKYRVSEAECDQGSRSWQLMLRDKSGVFRATARLSPPEINNLLAQGVFHKEKGNLRLSASGRAYIKREVYNNGSCSGQHQEIVASPFRDDPELRDLQINAKESPLYWLASRCDPQGKPMIERHQFLAGERLRADYERARLGPHTGGNWDQMGLPLERQRRAPGSGLNYSETMLVAKQRLFAALEVVGTELSIVLIDVCCDQIGLSDVEHRHQLPKRSGKVILRMGLNELARHYGLITDDRVGRAVRHRIRHWGVEGFRPQIDGEV